MRRRVFVSLLPAALVGTLLGSTDSEAGPRTRRRRRRGRRRRRRRRHRRRVVHRVVRGRRVWVAPVALAVGWELVHEDRVVVVQQIKTVEVDGESTEIAVVQGEDGKLEEVAFIREDTKDNAVELEGSELPEDEAK